MRTRILTEICLLPSQILPLLLHLTTSQPHSYKILYTLHDICNSYVPGGTAQNKFCANRNWVHIMLKSKLLKTLEPDQLQHNGTTASVIAQQYSSDTFSHCSFIPSRKYKACFSKTLFRPSFLYFLKLLESEIEELDFAKSGSTFRNHSSEDSKETIIVIRYLQFLTCYSALYRYLKTVVSWNI